MRFNKRNKRKLIAINKEDGGALRMDEDERKKLVNNVEVEGAEAKEEADDDDKDEEEVESDENDGFYNVVNENDDDSTDSEGDIEEEESDDGVEDVLYDHIDGKDVHDNEEDDDDDDSEQDEEEGSSHDDEDSSDNEEGSSDNEEGSSEYGDDIDEDQNEDDDLETVANVNDHSKHRTLQSDSKNKTKQYANKINEPSNEVTMPSNMINKLKHKKDVRAHEIKQSNEEYVVDDDTSDEEDIRNTIGNVPKNWYDEYKHLGYDWDGNRIIKPNRGDRLDEFLKRVEDREFWRTVKDPQTGQDVTLTDDDIDLIKRINQQKIPDATFDDYAPWIEWFTSEVMVMPVRKFPEHKRSFLPSKSEAKKVSKLVHALKMGWIKTREEEDKERERRREAGPQFYMLWSNDDKDEDVATRRIMKHVPAPKRHLPAHSESYNPPSEYLFDALEMKQWNKLKETPWKRKLHYLPQKYDSLRKVPTYERYVRERFLRCLDLYLCPRAIKMKLTIGPDDLVPKLPNPNDLQPFPSVKSITYVGHDDMIRTLSCDKHGQYLVTGSDDGTVKIWEICTGRCLKTYRTGGVVRCVEWCPNAAISLIIVASDSRAILINPSVGDRLIQTKTDKLLSIVPETEVITSDRVRNTVQWEHVTDEDDVDYATNSFRIVLKHFKEVSQVTWHCKGDYFATVMPDGQNRSVLISQLSKRRSQLPFNKSKGLIQSVAFHPLRPILFVATQRHVRVYDLMKQELIKKLMTNSKWISTIAVHPAGDNLLVGTYDRKMLWFDLDLSTKPYQTLRLHGTAVRGVAYHKRYPLFASCSDDKSVIVSHGMVYNDLLKNPLIVPLKRLQDHQSYNDFGCFDVLFHPTQPWLFTSGADGTAILYCN